MKIAIIGYGKMGQMIDQLATKMGHEVVLKIDKENSHDLTVSNLQIVDVAIEFSRPEVAFDNLSRCIEAGIPVVSGTTGWLDRKDSVEQLCKEKEGAFLYASNFSIGVNIFFALNKMLASMMEEQIQYEVNMEEIHHTQKLDAPSGTAITLAEGIIEKLNRKSAWVNKNKAVPDQSTFNTTDSDLTIISKRIDSVPGTHSIQYDSSVDSIEIKHTAHSREGFARGAIQAAEWIIGKQGVFSMQDVLGI
jgi:4-hydroxy-tetrahydrodipicolinate reductase